MNLLSILALVQSEMPEISQLSSAEEPAAEQSLSFISLALKGGWLMIPLLLLSVVSIYIFVERWMVIRAAGKEDSNFMNKVRDYISEGKIDAAIKLCRDSKTPYSNMIEKGITRLGRPMNDVLVIIENAGNMEVSKLEKGFSMLATTAAGAPMIGFLGTVTGMVRAFYDMASAGNNADITLLSSGIYQALTTTVAGLIVGIIAMFAYNILVARLDNVIAKMETKSMEFMDMLNEPM